MTNLQEEHAALLEDHATLKADNEALKKRVADLEAEVAKLKGAQPQPTPRWGSQPRIKMRTER